MTNTTGDFFDPYQRYSETSEAAAVAALPNAGTQRAAVLDFLQRRGQYGATDEEVQRALNMNPSTQRPRRIELQRANFICDSGSTRKTESMRNAVVWIIRDEQKVGVSPRSAYQFPKGAGNFGDKTR